MGFWSALGIWLSGTGGWGGQRGVGPRGVLGGGCWGAGRGVIFVVVFFFFCAALCAGGKNIENGVPGIKKMVRGPWRRDCAARAGTVGGFVFYKHVVVDFC